MKFRMKNRVAIVIQGRVMQPGEESAFESSLPPEFVAMRPDTFTFGSKRDVAPSLWTCELTIAGRNQPGFSERMQRIVAHAPQLFECQTLQTRMPYVLRARNDGPSPALFECRIDGLAVI